MKCTANHRDICVPTRLVCDGYVHCHQEEEAVCLRDVTISTKCKQDEFFCYLNFTCISKHQIVWSARWLQGSWRWVVLFWYVVCSSCNSHKFDWHLFPENPCFSPVRPSPVQANLGWLEQLHKHSLDVNKNDIFNAVLITLIFMGITTFPCFFQSWVIFQHLFWTTVRRPFSNLSRTLFIFSDHPKPVPYWPDMQAEWRLNGELSSEMDARDPPVSEVSTSFLTALYFAVWLCLALLNIGLVGTFHWAWPVFTICCKKQPSVPFDCVNCTLFYLLQEVIIRTPQDQTMYWSQPWMGRMKKSAWFYLTGNAKQPYLPWTPLLREEWPGSTPST